MVTWAQAGSSGGQSGQVAELLTLPGQVVVVEDGRPARQQPGQGGGGGRVAGQGADVLDHHQVGPGQGAGQPAGQVRAGVASMARPGSSRSARPAPATVRTDHPRRRNASPQWSATTETPSGPPSRNDTIATLFTGAPPRGPPDPSRGAVSPARAFSDRAGG